MGKLAELEVIPSHERGSLKRHYAFRGAQPPCRKAHGQLVSGVAFQSLRDLHKPGGQLRQHLLIVRAAHALGDFPGFARFLTECHAMSIDMSCHLVGQA
jgi:hypothetical protein